MYGLVDQGRSFGRGDRVVPDVGTQGVRVYDTGGAGQRRHSDGRSARPGDQRSDSAAVAEWTHAGASVPHHKIPGVTRRHG